MSAISAPSDNQDFKVRASICSVMPEQCLSLPRDAIVEWTRRRPGSDLMTDPTVTNLSVRGCRIALRRAGAGRPLLLLHGAADAGEWLPYMTELAARHDVIAPEHPGF